MNKNGTQGLLGATVKTVHNRLFTGVIIGHNPNLNLYSYNGILSLSGGETQTTKKPFGAGTPNGWKGGNPMYTDYGYEVDGVEYATLDEAFHRDDDDDE